MVKKAAKPLVFITALITAFILGTTIAQEKDNTIRTAVVSQEKAIENKNDWGNFYTYYTGETYGTKDVLCAVAHINPGMQVHPPHVHAEEEYLMVTEGQGTWHLNGKEFAAKKGDILYAAPWDIHGITNTGEKTLSFVVWKWNNKNMDLPPELVIPKKPSGFKVDE